MNGNDFGNTSVDTYTPWGIIDQRLEPDLARSQSLMCSPAPCYKCNKTTWAGCGMHVDQVMAHVPNEQQCKCD
jgi:hypothetical protein